MKTLKHCEKYLLVITISPSIVILTLISIINSCKSNFDGLNNASSITLKFKYISCLGIDIKSKHSLKIFQDIYMNQFNSFI